MDAVEGYGDEEPESGWISPDDRLWRHPSEVVGPPRATKHRGGESRLWTVAILAGAIASMLTSGLIVAAGGFRQPSVRAGLENLAAPTATQAALDRGATDVENIAAHIKPSIVYVGVQTDEGRVGASGVMFRADGHILTNHHVVTGARTIKVMLADGREVAAKLIGTDTDTDIAVVKVDGVTVPPARLGSATALKVGQVAICVGDPMVTTGVVSAVGRQVDHAGGSLLDMIQTDAPVSARASGGALVDSAGSVIGITTALVANERGIEGTGFAIPIDIARDVANQLIERGRVVHVWLGIEGDDLDKDKADSMKVPGGAVVKNVQTNSPAARAGLLPSDVIVGLDGEPVASMAGLVVALRTRQPGQVVKLDVRRAGVKHTIAATLAERPTLLRS